VVKRGKISASS